MWDVSQRELENLCNQVEKKKKKGEDVLIWVYVCGWQNAREKKKKKRKRMDERKGKE